jgi:hypothetical protein
MPGSALELVLTVGRGKDADEEDIAQLAYLLSAELHELDKVESIELLHEEAPQGAMGSGVLTGGMKIELAGPAGIPSLIATIETWLSRDKDRTLVMSLGDKNFQFPGLSKNEIRKLAQWFESQSG